jgi:hypothetical protein
MSENKEIDITVWSPLNYPVYAFSTMGFYEIKTEKDLNEHIKWMNFCYLDSYVIDENNKPFFEERDKELNELLDNHFKNLAILRKEQEELDKRKRVEGTDFLAKKDEIIKVIKKEAYLKKFQKINQ